MKPETRDQSMSRQTIRVDGTEITIKLVNQEDYISLTDIAKKRGSQKPNEVIRTWLRNSNTIPYLEAWERMNNPSFKDGNFDTFKIETIDNKDIITIKRYLEMTGAIGITSSAGRYGGTYAHRQIAFEFAGWIEPVFRLYITTEFERLKLEEAKRLNQEWDFGRFLSKINYPLQTEAIKENILPRLAKKDQPFAYSSEADMINLIIFGLTARQWRESQPDAKGNIRDHASLIELTVLANLESFNAQLIKVGASQEARFEALANMAHFQLGVFAQDKRLSSPKELLDNQGDSEKSEG